MCGKNGGGKGGKVFGKAKSRSSRVDLFMIIFNSWVKLTCLTTIGSHTLCGGVFGGFGGEERVGRKNYIAYSAIRPNKSMHAKFQVKKASLAGTFEK